MAKILIVEDNYCNFVLLREMLSKYKFDIIHAETGKEFHKHLNDHPLIHLILMDIGLPDTTGIELSKHVIDKDLKIPIIICSAYNDKCEEVYDLGIQYFIDKPINKELLISYMKKYIKFPE